MKINGQDVNIDDLYNQKYMHKEYKKGIFLSDIQLEILNRYGIDIDNIGSIDELIYQIEEILNDEESEELEMISKEISEFNYYANTNK